MIIKRDLDEAVTIATGVINGLLVQLDTKLEWDCGQVLATLSQQFLPTSKGFQNVFWTNLFILFEDCRVAGCTYDLMDNVRANAEALTPNGKLGIAVRNISIRYSLVELAKIVQATVYMSRNDIDDALDRINAAFLTAIDTAAMSFDQVIYQSLVALHAAVVADLNNRAQILPRIIFYNFPVSKNALWLAQRLYQDGSRAVELAAENQVSNPLWIMSPIRALSS